MHGKGVNDALLLQDREAAVALSAQATRSMPARGHEDSRDPRSQLLTTTGQTAPEVDE